MAAHRNLYYLFLKDRREHPMRSKAVYRLRILLQKQYSLAYGSKNEKNLKNRKDNS